VNASGGIGPRRVEAGGVAYTLEPQPVRSSLSDDAPMLWGFEVRVLRDGELLGVKTCFVGRVSVHVRDPSAPDRPMAELSVVLYDIATAAIVPRLEAGETGDEILFA
jgi:hypothetical protein